MMLSGTAIKQAIRDHETYQHMRHSDSLLCGPALYDAYETKKPRLVISEFDEKRLNPNSYNLRLAPELKVYTCESVDGPHLDMAQDNPTQDLYIPTCGLVLQPGMLYLGRTMEYTETHNCVPQLNGRSSTGRLGLCVHVTAGFGDVGFCGTWTLEITVVHPLKVYSGVEICQIAYTAITDSRMTYGQKGRYQNQIDATPSRMHTDFQTS